jgi:hypothetical protein
LQKKPSVDPCFDNFSIFADEDQKKLFQMKKSLLLLSIVFLSLHVSGQEFDVRSFAASPGDLTLRQSANQQQTRNGEQAALIKVTTNIRGMNFDSNIGIVDVDHRPDGYWVYVAPLERSIRMMADGFLSQQVSLPEPAKSLTVYHLVVAAKGVAPSVSDLVRITFRLNQSDVFIRSGNNAPVKSSGSNAVFNLPRGPHTFLFIKDGFDEKELTLDVQQEEVVDVDLTAGAPTAQFTLGGFVVVVSEPPGAEVYLNDQRVGITPYQVRHVAGTYNLRLAYPLYYDHTEQFELAGGATVTLPLITLKPRFGYWQVTSSPSDAEVFLNGKYIGNTPLERAEISSGTHELKIRKTLYHEHTETIIIEDGDEKSFPVNLDPAYGELRITSDPSGAEVFIEGRNVGKTPYVNLRQPSGSYNVRLSSDLYSDAHDQVLVSDGQKTEKFIPLSKNFGTLTINAGGADIYVNGEKAGSDAYTANLPPGQYTVAAKRALHKDDEREVFVLLGQTETVALSPQPRQGAVSIVTQPFEARGADIFVNNRRRSETTPAVIPLLIGNYEITVKKQGFLDQNRKVDIKEGQEEELTFRMQTFEGSMLQKARRHKTAKTIYGISTLAAAGAGAYFSISANALAGDYETAGTEAGSTYDKMEQHELYSYIAFGAAVPLAILTIVQRSRQKQAERKINVAAVPSADGVFVGITWTF